MTTNEIRKTWLDFFKSHNHLELPSKSLIPVNDPSLLWVNSGIATLKRYFSGIENPPSPRLVNSQRAIRTNDIMNVGITARHHTFFEMLGNFAIGDYFKEEAIKLAHELLTKHFLVNLNLIYITVYQDDDDTYNAWIKLGINKSHIVRGNKERNFWDVGQGPCGPCTEIFYDRGSQYDPTNIGTELFLKDIENDRYVEIWNIVFSQFNNDGKGNYTELSRKNIDTGAGLERIASISQQVPTDFDTDAFKPIIDAISSLTTKRYDMNSYFSKDVEQLIINRDYKIIADHIKACVFAIADGAVPSNKERGSVLRRLIRRAMISARRLQIKKSFISPVCIGVITATDEYYPYLKQSQERIVDVLTKEEELFKLTLENGFKLFDEIISKNDLHIDNVFKLVDTYGFPFEIIAELAKERGVVIDEATYEKKLQTHREVSRANLDVKGMVSQKEGLINFTTPSTFDYSKLTTKSKIIGLFNNDFKNVKTLDELGWIVFDNTVFYATSGGQQHDSGYIKSGNIKLDIIDVIKGPNGQHFHKIKPTRTLSVGDEYELCIDSDVRLKTSRNHSVEHLIQQALQTVIDKSIRQEGAFKSAEKVTFDFQYHNKLTNEQIIKVQNEVNKYIAQAHPVKTCMMDLEEAKQNGAIAWFDDVYRKIKGKLRVVFMGDVSKEICGGTHVANTKDIEQFFIVSLENKGGGAWRIEGLTSKDTVDNYLSNQVAIIQNDINKMNDDVNKANVLTNEFIALVKETDYDVAPNNLIKLREHLNRIQTLYHALMLKAHKDSSSNEIKTIKNFKKEVSNSKKVFHFVYQGKNIKTINQALTELINEDSEHAYVMFNLNEEQTKMQYIVIANKNYVEQHHFDANGVVKSLNQLSSGAGGGRKEFAQGGTTNTSKLDDLIQHIKSL